MTLRIWHVFLDIILLRKMCEGLIVVLFGPTCLD
ncbi:hypothetical protein Goshw_015467 [Gossypium schwendimanii]|uniref:Uncharacterized protein n=1 Tax=Gossypium schwendimanii TaxID=34291 RepID=A0A7J9LGB2_GOSSC|nr:hypothetical protein [Gossypium schwendimanii]